MLRRAEKFVWKDDAGDACTCSDGEEVKKKRAVKEEEEEKVKEEAKEEVKEESLAAVELSKIMQHATNELNWPQSRLRLYLEL